MILVIDCYNKYGNLLILTLPVYWQGLKWEQKPNGHHQVMI